MSETETVYRVDGMTCGGCARSLQAAIEQASPGLPIRVDHQANRLVVIGTHDPQLVEQAVESAGFDFNGVGDS